MFAKLHAAEVIHNAGLKPEILVERVISIIDTSSVQEQMSTAVQQLAKADATQAIAATVVQMARVPVVKTPKHEVLNI